jgi:hypothetical protein
MLAGSRGGEGRGWAKARTTRVAEEAEGTGGRVERVGEEREGH